MKVNGTEEYFENLSEFLRSLWYKYNNNPQITNAIATIDMVVESFAREYGIDLSKVNCVPDMEDPLDPADLAFGSIQEISDGELRSPTESFGFLPDDY